MKTLVLNCGSSSVKYQLFDTKTLQCNVKGNISRIGEQEAQVWQKNDQSEEINFKKEVANHKEAINLMIQLLLHEKYGVIKNIHEIGAVGHRVVHGGEKFAQPTLINNEVIVKIKECCSLAPLHNPHQLQGIIACQELLSETPQVAVFDTAFHQTMPPKAYIYGIPYSYYEKYQVRRYGFHGTSHYYVSQRVSELLKKEVHELKIISCHLGNGCSMTAIKHGKSIDTSMGFTPLEGLLMGTRAGDIDSSAILFS